MPAPRLHENGKIWTIPAGCLDDEPAVKVGEHIFTGSMAGWDPIAPGAAEHEAWGPEHEG